MHKKSHYTCLHVAIKEQRRIFTKIKILSSLVKISTVKNHFEHNHDIPHMGI